MEKKTWRPDEKWEGEVLERLASESEEKDLLNLAQDVAIKLASALGDARHELGQDDPEVDVDNVLRKVARVAVLLDALQLKYGDAVEEEIAFPQEIESALE